MSLRVIGRLAMGVAAAALSSACGGSSAAPSNAANPAARPSGASAHAVRYHCHAGRRDTIVVSLPDPRRVAEVLNPINVCEYDGGLADVTLGVVCSEGAPEKEIKLEA